MDASLRESTVGTALFEWVKHRGGHMLRKQIPRIDWKLKWALFSSQQKRYYGMIDEWDLGLASGEVKQSLGGNLDEPTILNDDNGPDLMRNMIVVEDDYDYGPELINDDLPSCDNRKEYYCEDLRAVYGAHVPQSTIDFLPLAEALRLRYGFMARTPYTTHPRMRRLIQSNKTARDVQRAMGNLAVKHCKDPSLGPAVVDLYNFVIANGTRPIAFPPLWDYDPKLKYDIYHDSKFQYHRVNSKLHIIGATGSHLCSQWYLLALQEATTILQMFRFPCNTLGNLTRMLIDQGIRFSTVKCLTREPRGATKRESIGLGRREADHKFDVIEYLAYEKAKGDILASSIGRAALMEGGIVWRLAKDIVRSGTVLQGPSELAKSQGTVMGSLGKYHLVDDRLQPADEDIICGVYHVLKGIP
jgi:hypothetical protein